MPAWMEILVIVIGYAGFIGIAHDITAAKNAEIELRRMNEILEQRIAQCTAQLESSEAQMRASPQPSDDPP